MNKERKLQNIWDSLSPGAITLSFVFLTTMGKNVELEFLETVSGMDKDIIVPPLWELNDQDLLIIEEKEQKTLYALEDNYFSFVSQKYADQ